jgi:hypothetical protein
MDGPMMLAVRTHHAGPSDHDLPVVKCRAKMAYGLCFCSCCCCCRPPHSSLVLAPLGYGAHAVAARCRPSASTRMRWNRPDVRFPCGCVTTLLSVPALSGDGATGADKRRRGLGGTNAPPQKDRPPARRPFLILPILVFLGRQRACTYASGCVCVRQAKTVPGVCPRKHSIMKMFSSAAAATRTALSVCGQ